MSERYTREQVDDSLAIVAVEADLLDRSPAAVVLAAEVIALRELLRKEQDAARENVTKLREELASVNTKVKGIFTSEFQAELRERTAECDKLREELRQWKEGETCLREPDCTCHQEEGDDECPVHDARAAIARVEAYAEKHVGSHYGITVAGLRKALKGES